MKKILLVLFFTMISHISVFADTVSSATATDIISENTKKVVFCNEIRKIAAEKDISKFLEIKALLKWKSIEKKLTPQARFTFFYSAYVLCSQEKSNVVGLYNPYLDFIFLMKLTGSEPLPKISDICLASGVSFRKNYVKENDKNFFSKVRNTNRVFSFLFSKPLDSLPVLSMNLKQTLCLQNLQADMNFYIENHLFKNKKFKSNILNIIRDYKQLSANEMISKYKKAKIPEVVFNDKNKEIISYFVEPKSNLLFMVMQDAKDINNITMFIFDASFELREIARYNLLTII